MTNSAPQDVWFQNDKLIIPLSTKGDSVTSRLFSYFTDLTSHPTLQPMWYYTLNGQQAGPISEAELAQMLNGALPSDTMVWKDGMADWLPAQDVEAFRNVEATIQAPSYAAGTTPAPSAAPTDGEAVNPYATPSSVVYQTPQTSDANEIPVEPIPLKVGFCFQQAIRHTNANFGKIFLLCITYCGIIFGIAVVFSIIGSAIDGPQTAISPDYEAFGEASEMMYEMAEEKTGPVGKILEFILGIIQTFLTLGAIAFMLSIARGEDASVSQLFSQRMGKVFKAYVANILYAIAIGVGLICLVFPGVYLALRYMFFMHAIVDKDLGIIESLNYSAELTRKNKLSLFGLVLVSILITIGGAIALLIGLFWALPVTYLALAIAYYYLHSGERSIAVQS